MEYGLTLVFARNGAIKDVLDKGNRTVIQFCYSICVRKFRGGGVRGCWRRLQMCMVVKIK